MARNEKSFASNIDAAIAAAAGTLQLKQEFESFDAAMEGTKDRTKFDPSVSQYVQGTVLDFNPEKMKIGIANIGNNGATVLSVPAGRKGADGKIVFNKAMNVYLSSLGKTIRVTDANGEPVLDADNNPEEVTGEGNTVWEAVSSCKSDSEILNYLKNKTLEVKKVLRGFGPSNFVEIGGSRVPKGHKLVSLPLFEEI